VIYCACEPTILLFHSHPPIPDKILNIFFTKFIFRLIKGAYNIVIFDRINDNIVTSPVLKRNFDPIKYFQEKFSQILG
jgi:hypothetical protein